MNQAEAEYQELCSRHQARSVKCEICDSGNVEVLNQIGRISVAGTYGNVPVVICKSCSHSYQSPRYNESFYEEYYNLLYRKVAFGAATPSENYIELQRVRGKNMREYMKEKEYINDQSRILDHGCASGETMQPFEDENYDICGIDPHEPSVETGCKNGRKITVGSGENLNLQGDSMDIIMSLGSLEHVYNINQSLEEIRRVLTKPDGLLIARWRSNFIWGSPYEYFNHNHYRFFTPFTWKILLLKHGFKTIDVDYNEIEGLTGAAYTIARVANSQDECDDELNKLLHSNIEQKVSERKNYIREVKSTGLARSERFIKFTENLGQDVGLIYNTIQNNNGLKKEFRLLFGEPKFAVDRAILESKNYLNAYRMDELK